MSAPWQLVCYLLGVVGFLLAAWGVHTGHRPASEFGWLGAALVTLVPLVGAFRAL
jgi:hypothetical protein